MPSKDQARFLRDILKSIDNITLFLGPMDFDEYERDRKTQAAVERELSIISEAAFRLGPDVDMICPGPNWRDIRGTGNTIRHGYHLINHSIIWDTVKDDLPELRIAVERTLSPQNPLTPPIQ